MAELVPFACVNCGHTALAATEEWSERGDVTLVAHVRDAYCSRCNAATRQVHRVPYVPDPVIEAMLADVDVTVELLTDEEKAQRDAETPVFDGYARKGTR